MITTNLDILVIGLLGLTETQSLVGVLIGFSTAAIGYIKIIHDRTIVEIKEGFKNERESFEARIKELKDLKDNAEAYAESIRSETMELLKTVDFTNK